MDNLTFPCDYPIILATLNSDGIHYTHTYSGIEWGYHGHEGRVYKVLPSHINRAHKINDSTWRRFIDWLLEVNP